MIRPHTLCLTVVLALPAAGMAQSTPELQLPEALDRELRRFKEQMTPWLDRTLKSLRGLERIDSLDHYELPEVLPNGDIILRRRPEAPAMPDAAPPPPPEPGVRT